jgi:hypothetical protein
MQTVYKNLSDVLKKRWTQSCRYYGEEFTKRGLRASREILTKPEAAFKYTPVTSVDDKRSFSKHKL